MAGGSGRLPENRRRSAKRCAGNGRARPAGRRERSSPSRSPWHRAVESRTVRTHPGSGSGNHLPRRGFYAAGGSNHDPLGAPFPARAPGPLGGHRNNAESGRALSFRPRPARIRKRPNPELATRPPAAGPARRRGLGLSPRQSAHHAGDCCYRSYRPLRATPPAGRHGLKGRWPNAHSGNRLSRVYRLRSGFCWVCWLAFHAADLVALLRAEIKNLRWPKPAGKPSMLLAKKERRPR
jgi:hypothetical protein